MKTWKIREDILLGGPRSGHHGHKGIPGHRGGSAASKGGGAVVAVEKPAQEEKKVSKPVTSGELRDIWGHPEYVRKGIPASVLSSYSVRELESVKKDPDVFTIGKSFFYRGGGTPEGHADNVINTFKKNGFVADILASGENWAPFSGGASAMSAKDSFWWSVVRVSRQE